MCLDYRILKKKTINNQHPIPQINDHIDELHRETFFSKIELRFGYHQIWVREKDVEKTMFKCYHGHFEFLFMSFGLTNAPTTFQSTMNRMSHSQLQRFVLVFFNEILVYSKTWDDLVAHLYIVLDILDIASLYANESKCVLRMK